MRVVAVLPFAVDETDPDANDLARWLARQAAQELAAAALLESRLVVDAVEVSAPALAQAAAQLQVDFALGASLRLSGEAVELSILLVDARGGVRGQWTEAGALGAAAQAGQAIARAALLALGEDAAVSARPMAAAPSGASVLRLARAARRLDEGEVDDGVRDLLALCEEEPAFEAARGTLLAAARDALETAQMPAFFFALERLAELRRSDAQVLLAVGEYRMAHLDAPGARAVLLAARDKAEDAAVAAQALSRLAALADSAGRTDETILHLRAAIKAADDPALYARLGTLLLERDPGEGVQMLSRATVLAPNDAGLHLALSRALRQHGGDLSRALAAAARAAKLCEEGSALAEEVRSEIELLLAKR